MEWFFPHPPCSSVGKGLSGPERGAGGEGQQAFAYFSSHKEEGHPRDLLLIFIPAGGGASPWTPSPPSLDPPPPPSAQVHLKTWVLGFFFNHGKQIFGAFGTCCILCTCCSTCAPYTLSCRPPCPNARCQCISAPRSNRCHSQNVKT